MKRKPARKAASEGPLVVSKTFPPGTILSPEGPAKVVRLLPRPKLTCPHCGHDKLRRAGRRGRVRYYECQRCVDRETLKLRVFKAVAEN